MVRMLFCFFIGLFCSMHVHAQEVRTDQTRAITGTLIRKIPSLKDFKSSTTLNPRVTRDLSGTIIKKTWKKNIVDQGTRAGRDPVVQSGFLRSGIRSMDQTMTGGKIEKDFDGMGFTNVAPADPCMTQGPNHIIQMINGPQGAYFKVWDKNGNQLVDKKYLYQVIASPGYAGWGDPIVLYDAFADRYFMSEFGTSNGITAYANTLIIAVSTTSNPAGGWNIYKFTDTEQFLDYPHYAIWPHTIFGTTNDFNTTGSAYLGASMIAIEKDKIIAGQANPVMIRSRPVSILPDINKQSTMAPVGISGSVAPANEQTGLFMYYTDDNYTSDPTDADSIGFIAFTPNFTNPSATTTQLSAHIPVGAFKSNICTGKDCIPGGAGYDAISDRIMHRVQYRNFGSYSAIVANHTVDANYPMLPPKAGLRWYEFRNGGSGWNLFQQGTYAPDGDSRWMGSININSKGQIALGFNYSAKDKYASIAFTGRNNTDPPGVMSYDETIIKEGVGYGTYGYRWGDYNDLTPDVLNDSLFWFTAMYGDINWKTKITSFKLEALPQIDAKLAAIYFPAPNSLLCQPTFTPRIVLRNAGTQLLQSSKIHYQVNGGVLQGPLTWNGNLSIAASDTFTLAPITGQTGNNTLTVYITNPNGGLDERTKNDTLRSNFLIQLPQPSPVQESFENSLFPTALWRNLNQRSIGWTRDSLLAHSGNASATLKFFDNDLVGDEDYLLTPLLNVNEADSITIDFWHAYALYDTDPKYADGLALVISTDCGNTFQELWKKEGVALSTVTGVRKDAYLPKADEWQHTSINLRPYIPIGTPSVTLGFKGINAYGNNLYLDDIRFRTVKIPNLDAAIAKIATPGSVVCSSPVAPTITLQNRGATPITSAKLYFQLDNGPIDFIQWNGNLAYNASTNISWNNFGKSITYNTPGAHTLLIYCEAVNGSNDLNPLNDTLRLQQTFFESQNAPLTLSFDVNQPSTERWGVQSAGNPISWDKTTQASKTGDGSIWMKNYTAMPGQVDILFGPLTKLGEVDSVYLQFDVAHATRVYPGSTTEPMDTLEVLVTKDCGNSFTSVYKKWGYELSTFSKNFPAVHPVSDTIGFIPTNISQWRTDWIDISSAALSSNSFQVVFKNTSAGGDNTYIDNVRISPVTLPAQLKQRGYIVIPNPFENGFMIRHLTAPAHLKVIQVMNMTGQTIAVKRFNGNAGKSIWIDLNTFQKGVYQVKMFYDDKIITERIIKIK